MKVVLTEAALDDLVQIGEFIKRDNPARARTFVDELYSRCRRIGNMPAAYPLLPGRGESGIRRRTYRDYLIFYRIAEERVEILRVLHGAQDYEPILFSED